MVARHALHTLRTLRRDYPFIHRIRYCNWRVWKSLSRTSTRVIHSSPFSIITVVGFPCYFTRLYIITTIRWLLSLGDRRNPSPVDLQIFLLSSLLTCRAIFVLKKALHSVDHQKFTKRQHRKSTTTQSSIYPFPSIKPITFVLRYRLQSFEPVRPEKQRRKPPSAVPPATEIRFPTSSQSPIPGKRRKTHEKHTVGAPANSHTIQICIAVWLCASAPSRLADVAIEFVDDNNKARNRGNPMLIDSHNIHI